MKQFCPQGHDTLVTGRDTNTDCRECKKASHRRWSKANLIKRTCYRYKISESDLLTLISNQKDLCAICKKKTKLVVDHDHKTDRVRGLLCTRCNLVLGQCGDDPQLLTELVKYLTDLGEPI